MARAVQKGCLMGLAMVLLVLGICGLVPTRGFAQGPSPVVGAPVGGVPAGGVPGAGGGEKGAEQGPNGPKVTIAPAAAGPLPFALSENCYLGGNPLDDLAPLPNTVRAIKDRKNVRLLAIGATSVARRSRPGGGYDLLMEALLEQTVKGLTVDVIERGISGELAASAAERLIIEVALEKPDLVLWQVGTNDAMANIPVANIERTISETVRWLRAHDIDVILVGLHYARAMRKDPHYQKMRAMLKRVTKTLKVMRIGRYEAAEIAYGTATQRRGIPFQEVAQTEQSYDCVAERIARGITSVLFAKRAKQQGTIPRR